MALSETRLNSLRLAVAEMETLDLEPNKPVEVPRNYKCVTATSQKKSYLQIQNLSVQYVGSYFAEGGPGFCEDGSIAVGGDPVKWIHNFNGSQLVVANVSAYDATLLVTLI